MKICLVVALVLVLATSAFGLEKKAYQMKEDFGTEPLQGVPLQFFYYIPCPTYSWFWAYSGWTPGDVVGMGFPIGVQGTGGFDPMDPYDCRVLEGIRILDFAGYGTVYPGLFDIQFYVWCCIGPPGPDHEHVLLWVSPVLVTHFAWNYFWLDELGGLLSFCPCPPNQCGYPVLTVTAEHVGTDGRYPAWGLDNISTPLSQVPPCDMTDIGGLPASYPRGAPGSYPCMPEVGIQVHGGYYGTDPTTCPPIGIPDGRDTTPDATQFGYIELAWRIYVICSGPTATEPSTWGNIKAMYE
jgi:hypothetical protein